MLLEKIDSAKSEPPKDVAARRKGVCLLVCGDRNWQDYAAILKEIKLLLPEVVIEGEAKGADTWARLAAQELGITVLKFPADWNKYGKSAGPIRNIQMLKEGQPDLVLAFHDDVEHSKGTKNMVEISRKAGVAVKIWTHSKAKIKEND